MAEGGSAASSSRPSASGIINQFIPRPTLQPVLYWQGIVEIIARGVLLVIGKYMYIIEHTLYVPIP